MACVSSIMHHLLSTIYCIQDLVKCYQKYFLLWLLQSNIPYPAYNDLLPLYTGFIMGGLVA